MKDEPKINEFKEVTTELVGMEDNRVFRTLHHLMTCPGRIIADYAAGAKEKYLSPVLYFFGVTAIETYLANVTGLFDFMMKSNVDSLQKSLSDPALGKSADYISSRAGEMNSAFEFLFSETGQKITILPAALLFTWLVYKRYNRSFKANSWFTLYTLGHATLLTLPLLLYWYLTEDILGYSFLGLSVASVYWIWASMQFYQIGLWKAVLLRVVVLLSVLASISVLSFILAAAFLMQ